MVALLCGSIYKQLSINNFSYLYSAVSNRNHPFHYSPVNTYSILKFACIITSCSSERAGNNGFNSNISAIMQPILHISAPKL